MAMAMAMAMGGGLRVVLAGLADGLQDFLNDPLTKGLRGWGVAK
jgi:hypothetical protein